VIALLLLWHAWLPATTAWAANNEAQVAVQQTHAGQANRSYATTDGYWLLKEPGRWTEVPNLDPTCQSTASGSESRIAISQTCRHADGSTSLFAGTISWQWSTEAGHSLNELFPGQVVTVSASAANTGNRTEIGGVFRMEKEDLPPGQSFGSAIDIAQIVAHVGAPTASATGTLTVPPGPYFPATRLMSLRAAGSYIGAVDRVYEWVDGPPPPTRTPTATASRTATATRTPTRTLTATATPAIDITIAGVEHTQVIQCLDQSTGATNCRDNAIPMVKGKNTVVRVYPAMRILGQSAPQATTHDAELHIDAPIRAAIRSLNGPIALKPAADRGVADDTLNFRLPLVWTEHDEIELRVELNAGRAIPETDYGNNRQVFRIAFHERRPLRIRYVAVRVPGAPALPDEREMRRAEALARTLFPLRQGDLHYVRGATLNYARPVTSNPELTNLVLWLDIQDRLAHLLGSDRRDYDQLVGWYPYPPTPLSTGISSPRWDKPPGRGHVAAVMSYNAVSSNNQYHDSYTLAHEIAHNLGLRHSSNASKRPTQADACNAFSGVDHWPYETIDIQEVGYQVLLSGQTAIKVPRIHSDFMSYCNYYDPQQRKLSLDLGRPSTAFWVSPFHYNLLFRANSQPSLGVPISLQAMALVPASEWALVRGVVSRTGGSAIHNVQHVPGSLAEDPPPGGSDYSIEWQDASGMPLDSFFFDADFLDKEGQPVDEEPFLFTLPYPDGTEQVVLKRDTTVLARHVRSAHAPTLAITTPLGGERWSGLETIRWEAADADGDTVTVSLFYRPNDSAAWLPVNADVVGSAFEIDSREVPGGTDARVLLVASDGFNTTIAMSEPFSVTRKGPQPIILEPLDGAELKPASPLVLAGSGYDLEDGALDAASFAWSSDRLGALGTGIEVSLAGLPEGDHRLTLLARDMDGNSGSDTILVHVRGSGECAGDCDGNAEVTIDELIRGVNIALGSAALDTCRAFDKNGDQAVTIDELILAVNRALNGCLVEFGNPQ
jgi:hypothetical protein